MGPLSLDNWSHLNFRCHCSRHSHWTQHHRHLPYLQKQWMLGQRHRRHHQRPRSLTTMCPPTSWLTLLQNHRHRHRLEPRNLKFPRRRRPPTGIPLPDWPGSGWRRLWSALSCWPRWCRGPATVWCRPPAPRCPCLRPNPSRFARSGHRCQIG